MNRIILSVLLVLVAIAVSPVQAETLSVSSEKDYLHKICTNFTLPIAEKALESKALDASESDFVVWLDRIMMKGAEINGRISYASTQDKKTMRLIIRGVYNGTWKSTAEAVGDCKAGGDTFPNSERANLKSIREYFGNQKKQASH